MAVLRFQGRTQKLVCHTMKISPKPDYSLCSTLSHCSWDDTFGKSLWSWGTTQIQKLLASSGQLGH